MAGKIFLSLLFFLNFGQLDGKFNSFSKPVLELPRQKKASLLHTCDINSCNTNESICNKNLNISLNILLNKPFDSVSFYDFYHLQYLCCTKIHLYETNCPKVKIFLKQFRSKSEILSDNM